MASKNSDQYNTDIEHLIDKDYSKRKKAADEIRSGKFIFTYDPAELIDEFLKNGRNAKGKIFLPLKSDYHYIIADNLLMSTEMLKEHKRLTHKYPETKELFESIKIVMKSFWPTGDAIKDYKFYRSFLNFDIVELAKKVSIELPVTHDAVKEFIGHDKVDIDIAIPRMIHEYSRFFELSEPVINLVRIGLELKRGNASPDRQYESWQNIRILKSDPDCGPLFGCLDEQIRHADKVARKIDPADARSGKKQTVETYTFDECSNMLDLMLNKFSPVIFSSVLLFSVTTLILLLVNHEYKQLLLALGR